MSLVAAKTATQASQVQFAQLKKEYDELQALKPVEALATQRSEIARLTDYVDALQRDAAMNQQKRQETERRLTFAVTRAADATSEAANCGKLLEICQKELGKRRQPQ